jgi:hypothetical protein
MDQENNNQQEEVPALSTNSNAHNDTGDGSNSLIIPAPVPNTPPALKSTTTGSPPPHTVSQRRSRLNRVIIIKRRQQRSSRVESTAPRLMITTFIIAVVLFLLLSSSAGGAYAYYQSQLPLLNGIASHSLFQTTHIYDRNGKLLYDLYDPKYGRRTYVNYNDISPLMINATVAAEDHTFWDNSGVDFQGIVRAAITNLQSHSIVEGGSSDPRQ